MTFDKYKQGREKYNDCIYPQDGYMYSYIWTKDIGWYVVKGKKIPEFIPGSTWTNRFEVKGVKENDK